MKFLIKIAYRFLKSNKAQTILITVGIAIGIGVQIFLGLLIQNLQKDLISSTVGGSSHITIKDTDNKLINNIDELKQKVISSSDGIKWASNTLDMPALLGDDEKNTSVLVRGSDLQNSNEIYKFEDSLVEGNMPERLGEVIIGNELKAKFNIKLGETINLSTSKGDIKEVKVVGTFDKKVAAINRSWVVGSIETAQNIFGIPQGTGNSIEISVDMKDIFNADLIQNEISNVVPEGITITNWKVENEALLSGLTGQSASSYTIQVFVMVSVIVGISGILAVSVMQKNKQLGILKAMGIKDKAASRIFLIQGLIFGVLGGTLGGILGVGLFKGFITFVKDSEGMSIVSGGINYNFILISILIGIVASIIASLIPARQSLKLNPVEIIRNN
ncbi:ABC transporter permease [Clostridium vincentii]|uniref:Lipoprotein-releasing system transmembrane protein LolE n=1 Tax=Clostridium vincentii TaxID=52704 RepID=A0A2T0BDY9_9CLOT|nr:FtsX-like permease family protein [Clostridium vincentii]PRR82100.1 Lipoprotein-releasing system transmembrane protein LolE [Clostridium vincentii]